MLNLAPWYYRKLFQEKTIISHFDYYSVQLFDHQQYFESNAFLNKNIRPNWLIESKIYKNSDGTGTDRFKNIAAYKAVSEALERYAFYFYADQNNEKYCFDIDPTTTGMAAFPHFSTKYARANARQEAIERWAIHEFNRNHLPVKFQDLTYPNLKAYELIVPFNDVKVCILSLNENGFFSFAFAAGVTFEKAIARAKIELNRNRTVIKKAKEKGLSEFTEPVDKTLYYFSSDEGTQKFNELIQSAPKTIKNSNPTVICDLEMIGPWSEYTKVWRYLLEDSYFDCSRDHTFFMF